MTTNRKLSKNKQSRTDLSEKKIEKAKNDKRRARAKAYLEEVLQQSQPTKFIKQEEELIPEDSVWWLATLYEATGAKDRELGITLLNQAICTTYKWKDDPLLTTNTTLSAMHEISPKDIREGMLAAQMTGAHNMAMECMRRALIEGIHPDSTHRYMKMANQFSRTFTMHIEALNKLRGKGQQKVTVKHVHVNSGGQAVVGSVEGRGGDDSQ